MDQQEDAAACLFTWSKRPSASTFSDVPALVDAKKKEQQSFLRQSTPIAIKHNVAVYSKLKAAFRVEEGIFSELSRHKDVNLVMLRLSAGSPSGASQQCPQGSHDDGDRNVAVLRIAVCLTPSAHPVPVGSGPRARLPCRWRGISSCLMTPVKSSPRAVRGEVDEERLEDEELQVHEIVEQEVDGISSVKFKVRTTDSMRTVSWRNVRKAL